jgi:mannose-6-phosphate isomerase-like protein (cupin superfamily)
MTVVPAQGEVITDRPGRRITILLDTPELAITESIYGPGERGPDPHVHHEHTDSFIVVEGMLAFGLRDGTVQAPSGTFVSVPREVVHSFRNESSETTRFFNFHAPSCGFGDYLRGRNPGFDQHDPPSDGGGDPASVVVVELSGIEAV